MRVYKNDHDKKFAITLSNPFDEIQLIVSTSHDHGLWVNFLGNAICVAKSSLRGFMLKKSEPFQAKMKYFILHEDVISCHKSSQHLSASQGCVFFHPGTVVTFNDSSQEIDVLDIDNDQQ